MTRMTRIEPNPWESIPEQMLAEVAIRLELPPSKYRILAERKQAIEKHLERDGSPLKDRIRLFYQQGSVAIGATIQAKSRNEGYDIDIVVELLQEGLSPADALDILFDAVRGKPGFRYYTMTERQSRCVTVHYQDKMHIDLTPSQLLDESDPRLSYIFHSKPEESPRSDCKILTNSYAFVEEYNLNCPKNKEFMAEYSRRAHSADVDSVIEVAKGDSIPIPDLSIESGAKSATTVALQLLKRYRNLRYESRHGRMPASVMLSCLALEATESNPTIWQNLLSISSHILRRLKHAHGSGKLIDVRNPRCNEDVFTDRWPEHLDSQQKFIKDMELFVLMLKQFLNPNTSFADRSRLLKEMFGEDVGSFVSKKISEELAKATRTGTFELSATGGLLVSPNPTFAKPTHPKSTFYGGSKFVRASSQNGAKSIEAQICSMAKRWPNFELAVKDFGGSAVMFLGTLAPLGRQYRVSIDYGLPRAGSKDFFRAMPVVRVLAPRLVPNLSDRVEGPLPHVYFDKGDIARSPLCLFDPKANEWDPSMLISDTTVIWTIRWLANYELWEADGKWLGGGRHDRPMQDTNAQEN